MLDPTKTADRAARMDSCLAFQAIACPRDNVRQCHSNVADDHCSIDECIMRLCDEMHEEALFVEDIL